MQSGESVQFRREPWVQPAIDEMKSGEAENIIQFRRDPWVEPAIEEMNLADAENLAPFAADGVGSTS